MSAFLIAIQDIAEWTISTIVYLLPFDASNRLHWTGLLAFFVLGFIAYRRYGNTSLLRFLFPSKMYLSQSFGVDVKVYIANKFITPALGSLTLAAQIAVIAMIAGLIAPDKPEVSFGLGTMLITTILFWVAKDFVYYITHRASHENALLWPFHKLHHSAEHLTPLTAKRNHPVFNLILMSVNTLFVGVLGGVIFGLFGVVEIINIFGISLTVAVFNLAGGALRHSHVWIDYGPVVDRILISPAQHQIHHSSAPRHHDCNYGLMLAIWDWMFGTLYVPSGKEELEFGVADQTGTLMPQKHTGLKTAMLVPFQEAAEALEARDQRQTEYVR